MPDRTSPPPICKPAHLPVREPACVRMPNGIPVYVFDAGESDVVRIDLLFEGGRWQQELPLQALFTNRMLREGTVRFSSGEIAERLDYYGAWLELASAAEYTYLTLYSLGKYLPETLAVLESVVKEPLFPEKELKVVLETNIRQFLVNSSKAEYLAGRALMNLLFGAGHPLGHVLCEDDYRRLTPGVLRHFYDRYYHSAHCSIYLAGRIDGRCLRLVEEHFGQEPFGGVLQAPAGHGRFRPAGGPEDTRFLKREGAAQNAIRMGMLSLNQHHPDYLKLRVLVTLFGGYFGSRLMSNIREQKGYLRHISHPAALSGRRRADHIGGYRPAIRAPLVEGSAGGDGPLARGTGARRRVGAGAQLHAGRDVPQLRVGLFAFGRVDIHPHLRFGQILFYGHRRGHRNRYLG